jgi:DNA recombination protein RmuC
MGSLGLFVVSAGFVAALVFGAVVIARALGRMQGDLLRLAQAQDEVRRDVNGARESSHRQIADAQKALAEVKAIEAGRARQMEQAADALRRVESVIAGSASRGIAGENVLARALGQLPPDLLEVNVAFGGRVVEYALRLPGGRLLPIDSKWTSAAALERLDVTTDTAERKRLSEQVTREIKSRAREIGKYLDPERTLAIGILAVPDAAYTASPEVHGEAYREGVLVVPYSLALPYVLALYRLTLRFGASADGDETAERLRSLEASLRQIGDELEGRLSRGLVQMANSRDALRESVGEARRTTGRLLRDAESPDAAETPVRLVASRD